MHTKNAEAQYVQVAVYAARALRTWKLNHADVPAGVLPVCEWGWLRRTDTKGVEL